MTGCLTVGIAPHPRRFGPVRHNGNGMLVAKFLIFLVMLAGSVGLDRLVRPRPFRRGRVTGRSLPGIALHGAITSVVFGVLLAVCGNATASALLTLALVGLFVMVSNAKQAMLGEPLVFSDLALIAAVFQHPQFYMSALSGAQKVALGVLALALPGLLWWLFVPDPAPHGIGAALAVLGVGLIALSLRLGPWSALARVPDGEADVARHGLLATLLLHWARWRATPDPAPCPPLRACAAPAPDRAEIAIVIQCESFADPVALFGDDALALPGLAATRAVAWQAGNLEVCGFGAYTMRTEYGVLFGRDEAQLGFRRFDPFLTALGEASHAMSARLAGAGWRSLFVHPHDMRFYNRDRIMRAAGFADLVGQDHFAAPDAGEGRYVSDAAMAGRIMELARAARAPTLIYAVTIENHGPWSGAGSRGPDALRQGYLRLVRNSDAMLTTLVDQIRALGRPALLAFFGDHRPSIPGVSMPGGPRHTPYAIVRTDGQGRVLPGDGAQQDLTPAQLHHAIIGLLAAE